MVSSPQSGPSPVVRRIGLALALAGIDPRAASRAIRTFPRYVRDLRRFRALSAFGGYSSPRFRDLLPALGDASDEAGSAGSEYFLADLWVARRIYRAAPLRHVDVGSRIDGLIAHLLTFREVDVVDIRPLHSDVAGLRFVQADATSLDGIDSGSLPSVSSVHALEHFGLGRYGDPLDPDGHVKGIRSLGRVTAPGGDLYLAAPVGRPSIEFNAHRVLDPGLVPATLAGFEVLDFAAVVDGEVREGIAPGDVAGVRYACGLYHLRREP